MRRSVLLLAALGCRRELPRDLVLSDAPYVQNVIVASFDVPGDDPAEIRVERSGDAVLTVPAVVQDGTATASIVGLKPRERYRLVGVSGGRDRADSDVDTIDPPDALTFDVDAIDDDADLAHGYVLVPLSGAWSGVVAVDNEGDPRWWVESEPGWTASSPRLTRDGQAVLWIAGDVGREEYDQRLVRVELDGSARDVRTVYAGHHMVAELDQGEFVWPSWDIRDVPWDQGFVEPVLSDRVLVGDGVSEPRTLVSFFDDRGPAYVECSHGLEIDDWLGQPVYEWTHTNSVVWLPERDVLIVTARLIDSILEVERQSGAVHWQLGGRDGTLAIDEDDRFSHGHMSDAWDGGLLMFDNGSHHRVRESRVIEYAIDAETGTARVVWNHPDPDHAFYSFLGDARRLPSDDVLIAWSTGGRIEEVARNHDVRWRIWAPNGATVGRIRYTPSLQPRALPQEP